MESLKLKKLQRKLKRQEAKKINSRFNFGIAKNGNIITSTYNPKAHAYNKLIRDINNQRDANFEKMLEAYNKGEVSVSASKPKSKGFKRNEYKKSVILMNDTIDFIRSFYPNGRALCQ